MPPQVNEIQVWSVNDAPYAMFKCEAYWGLNPRLIAEKDFNIIFKNQLNQKFNQVVEGLQTDFILLASILWMWEQGDDTIPYFK